MQLKLLSQITGYDSECWSITDADEKAVASAGNQSGSATTEHCFDLVSGCFTLNLYDAYSDGWGGSGGLNHTLTVGGVDYTFEPYTGSPVSGAPANADNLFTHTIGGGCVIGCSDSIAKDYNADADIIDNSLCEYALVQEGCTDVAACNYDELAEQDNGSCTYAAEGLDCDGNCLEGTYTSISVSEISTVGYTYSLTTYGGSWSLADANSRRGIINCWR